jgi:hypothetical protein
MAVAYFTQWPPLAAGTNDRVAERINQHLGEQPPAGGLYHAEGPTDEGGWWTFDVWASPGDYEAFTQQILQPVLDELHVPRSEPRQLQVQWETSQLSGGS